MRGTGAGYGYFLYGSVGVQQQGNSVTVSASAFALAAWQRLGFVPASDWVRVDDRRGTAQCDYDPKKCKCVLTADANGSRARSKRVGRWFRKVDLGASAAVFIEHQTQTSVTFATAYGAAFGGTVNISGGVGAKRGGLSISVDFTFTNNVTDKIEQQHLRVTATCRTID